MNRIGFSGRYISQKDKEFSQFLDIIKEKDISSYLEIGARHGDSFYDIVTSLPQGSKAVAIDLPNSSWGMSDSQEKLEECVSELCYLGYDAHVLFADSTTDHAVNYAKHHGNFDLVFLDGDHRYDGIKLDFELYLPLANKLVAFHDIAEIVYNPKHDMTVEVKKLWEEIKCDYKHHEYIDARCKIQMGIGVLEL